MDTNEWNTIAPWASGNWRYATTTSNSTSTISWPNMVLNQTWPAKREPGEYDEMELAAAHAKIDQLTEELKALVLRVQDLESR